MHSKIGKLLFNFRTEMATYMVDFGSMPETTRLPLGALTNRQPACHGLETCTDRSKGVNRTSRVVSTPTFGPCVVCIKASSLRFPGLFLIVDRVQEGNIGAALSQQGQEG